MFENRIKPIAFISLLVGSLFVVSLAIADDHGVSQTGALEEFGIRVARYAELHRELGNEIPPLEKAMKPIQIAAHRQALARAIRAARPRARQGDFFSAGVSSEFVRIVRSELRGPRGANLRATIRDGDPLEEGCLAVVWLKVNASYPEGAPLSTMPPALLDRLPALPKELEYRFVGNDLILRDVVANVFVDFIRDVVPG